MQQYKKDFIELLVKAEALKFGEFTLKSGRVAPYFMNAGNFYTGELLNGLAKAYAEAFLDYEMECDVIFGPAYKGIPLAATVTNELFAKFQKNVAYCFNRKEVKDHGEAGLLVGAPLNSETKVLLIDDVITAGTAIRETMDILKASGNPQISGVLISFDRMEKNNEGVGAIKAVESDFGIKVYSIVNIDDVVEVLYNKEVDGKIYIDDEKMDLIRKYRDKYGD
ncbi:MAG: orotate phosphoribosyltransferase [Candidatus Gracilibacteria bacterium]|nr:orotate phosphoribosyltransferase [Candidatus Gracilibacteria bacterium]